MATRRSTTEIESLAELDELVAHGATTMHGWRVQGVDLRQRSEVLLRLDPAGAAFFGCPMADDVAEAMRAGGALLFPPIPDLPFDAYPGALYTPLQLYDRLTEATYEECLDGRVYAWTRSSDPRDATLTVARALHDHLIEDALDDILATLADAGGAVVGVMGGHQTRRGDDGYAEAARLGRLLTRAGLTVATGGGPGAMEAANLGAYLSAADEAVLAEALGHLSTVPTFVPSRTAWARVALQIRARTPEGAASIGIPTWFYGHEPPNLFAQQIAKYFQNALREAVLLQRCSGGVVFLPGAAGTVQEIFADASENYYAASGLAAPMVLLGRAYWEHTLPAWPLLEALGRGREMAGRIACVDTVDEALAWLTNASSARRARRRS